jgi:hypothetical protein
MSHYEHQAQLNIHGQISAAQPYGPEMVRDVAHKINYSMMASDVVNATYPDIAEFSDYEYEQICGYHERRLRNYAALTINQYISEGAKC